MDTKEADSVLDRCLLSQRYASLLSVERSLMLAQMAKFLDNSIVKKALGSNEEENRSG